MFYCRLLYILFTAQNKYYLLHDMLLLYSYYFCSYTLESVFYVEVIIGVEPTAIQQPSLRNQSNYPLLYPAIYYINVCKVHVCPYQRNYLEN